MSQELIKTALRPLFTDQTSMSLDGWTAEQQKIGETTDILRRYAAGDHRSNLTQQMRQLLRLPQNEQLTEFQDNYMDVVVQTMNDRIQIEGITADNDAMTKWLEAVQRQNRFDGMQSDVSEATIRDANTYALVDWEPETGRLRITPELAYDGTSGMLMLYANRQKLAAVKVWHVFSDGDGHDNWTYVNVYYADRIEKYESKGSGQLVPRKDEQGNHIYPWVDRSGQPLGIPVFHFANRRDPGTMYGKSEIEDAVPLQDALNRTLYSMVMASELSAFQVRYAIGFQPPAGLTPGMWVVIGGDGLNAEDKVDLGVLEHGELVPYIEVANHIKNEIFDVTNTPRQGTASSNSSGESLKQREIGLLGKVRRFTTKAASTWEEVFMMAHRVADTYSLEKPPAYEFIEIKWKPAEIRNDQEIIKTALEEYKAGAITQRVYLETVAPIRGWSQQKIDEILNDTQAQRSQVITSAIQSLPGFGEFAA